MSQSDSILLRRALLVNAAFSFTTGLSLALAPVAIGSLIGFEQTNLLRLVGGGLLLFAADLVHQGTRPVMSGLRALGASAGDLIWVAGTAALLALGSALFSPLGHGALIAVAAVVLTCAVLQLAGTYRLLRESDARLGTAYRHEMVVKVDASAEHMWAAISDLAAIQNHVPDLTESFIRGGEEPGLGVVRECSDGTQRWSEEVVQFDSGEALTMRFREEEPDFPFPFTRMLGGWSVVPNQNGSEVRIWWSFSPKRPWIGMLLTAVMGAQMNWSFPAVVRSMAR